MGLLKWKIRRMLGVPSVRQGYKLHTFYNPQLSCSTCAKDRERMNFLYGEDFLSERSHIDSLDATLCNEWRVLSSAFCDGRSSPLTITVHEIPPQDRQHITVQVEMEKHYNDDGTYWRHHIIDIYLPIGIIRDRYKVNPEWKVVRM